jgi:hypothetical protein
MTKEEIADLATYTTLMVFLDENNAKIQENELVLEDVAHFQDLGQQFSDKHDEAKEPITEITANKTKLKDRLSAKTSVIFKYLQSQAVRKKDQTLLDMPKPTKAAMFGLTDAEFTTLMNDMVNRVATYSTVLVQYSFTLEEQAAFQADVAAFVAVKPQIQIKKKGMKGTTQSLKEVHQEIDDSLEFRLDVSILNLQTKYPAFVQHYFELRVGRAIPVSFTQVTIKTINDATNQPEPNVNVNLPDLNIKTMTDEKGKLSVKTGRLKALIVQLSKPSFQDEERTVTKIIRGRTIVLEVRLKLA